MKGISLFASSGIGDLAVRAVGVEIVVANELISERAELFSANYPDATVFCGDIWERKADIISATQKVLGSEPLDFLIATPPCQGMSKNGQGKLLAEIRAGNRPPLDPRNRLIIPTLDIAVALQPEIVVFENVPEMANTVIQDESGQLIRILDYIPKRLGPNYVGQAEVVEFANYGVPQRRQRLITIYSRNKGIGKYFAEHGTLIAPTTHSSEPNGNQTPWVTLRDTISSFPRLEARIGQNEKVDFDPMHRVPILDDKKFTWVANTPEGKSAFDNQCANPECLYAQNATHGASRNADGINQASIETPLWCASCGALLPRPYTEERGEKRLMKGFTSAYKRMQWDLPAPTLTTNLSYPSSDQNLHPEQNRVLSLAEALTIHTIKNYDFIWESPAGRPVKDGLVRDTIGESIPPYGLEILLRHIIHLRCGHGD